MVARVIDHPFSIGAIPTPYNPDPALLAIVEVIRDGLVRDQHVRLHNFGTFRLRWSKERHTKNPRTGAAITVAPTPRITFTPAKHLREIIDPDRKPSIPMDDPAISNPPENHTEGKTRQFKPGASAKNDHIKEEQKKNDLPNLAETVQDVIDENFTPPEQHTVNHHFQQEDKKNKGRIFHKKWALGMLAAVPLILALLQVDFATNREAIDDASQNTGLNTFVDQTKQNSAPGHSISPTEQNSPDIRQAGTRSGTDINRKPLPTERPETISSAFYMSPQLHTIQSGENLWKLAERFYGDALLWPHIYRANMRTITDPDKIISGQQIVIPGLQQEPGNLSRKDRELIADGYYEVYQANRAKHHQQAIYFLISAKQYSYGWLMKMKAGIPSKDWDVINR